MDGPHHSLGSRSMACLRSSLPSVSSTPRLLGEPAGAARLTATLIEVNGLDVVLLLMAPSVEWYRRLVRPWHRFIGVTLNLGEGSWCAAWWIKSYGNQHYLAL